MGDWSGGAWDPSWDASGAAAQGYGDSSWGANWGPGPWGAPGNTAWNSAGACAGSSAWGPEWWGSADGGSTGCGCGSWKGKGTDGSAYPQGEQWYPPGHDWYAGAAGTAEWYPQSADWGQAPSQENGLGCDSSSPWPAAPKGGGPKGGEEKFGKGGGEAAPAPAASSEDAASMEPEQLAAPNGAAHPTPTGDAQDSPAPHEQQSEQPPPANVEPKTEEKPQTNSNGHEVPSETAAAPQVEEELIGDTPWFMRMQHEISNPSQAAGDDSQEQPTEEQLQALQSIVGALGSVVPPGSKPQSTLFAESLKLIYAVLGLLGEGQCPSQLRDRAMMNASNTFVWEGLRTIPRPMHGRAIGAMLGQWCDAPHLLQTMAKGCVRQAFDAASAGHRAQFLCALSRALFLEVMKRQQARYHWHAIVEAFPELAKLRKLLKHIRSRCWEDERDRSKSRSRSREKRKSDKKAQNALPPNGVRFFIKGYQCMEDEPLYEHFSTYGSVLECTVVRDKKTGRPRGLAFVTLEASGTWNGELVTPASVRQWVLGSEHSVKGETLEVAEAVDKSAEDEEKRRQDRERRVAERRRVREERALRGGGDPLPGRWVQSSWAKRWRQDIVSMLASAGNGWPVPWSDPTLRLLCRSLWIDVAEHITRTGAAEVREALGLFRAPAAEDAEAVAVTPAWAFVPAADLLLILADGLLGLTIEGVTLSPMPAEPSPPVLGWDPDAFNLGARPLIAEPAALLPPGSGASMGQAVNNIVFSRDSAGKKHLERGASVEEKIFVGGLSRDTTLEMMMAYFRKYGNITDAVVMVDKVTGKPRGFGFVVFDSAAAVENVINDYSNHMIDGKWIEVKKANPRGEDMMMMMDDGAKIH